MGKYYKEFSDFLRERFPGKMQKLTVNAGFTCPNRDGTVGWGGCADCNNSSFSPAHDAASVSGQIAEGKMFFARKYPDMRYLAYFQSYTNTHGEMGRLLGLYEEALSVDGVDGLIIGTRPDCVSRDLLSALKGLGRWVMLEYGAESSHDATLQRVNRCHSWRHTCEAVNLTAEIGLPVGLHLIMGLPGESRRMMLETVRRVCALPVDSVKFHQLQIIKGTPLARAMERGELRAVSPGVLDAFVGEGGGADCFAAFSVEEYRDLCADAVEVISEVRPAMAVERFTSQAPDGFLIAPKWGLKNYQFMNLLHNRLACRCGKR